MAIANLTVANPIIPQPDHSWLDGLAKSLGGTIDNIAAGKIINEDLAARGLAPAPASGGGFLGKLLGGGNQRQPQTAFTGPVTSQQISGQPAISGRADLQGDTYRPFIDTVRSGGLTNPYGLAAVASTGKAESGWSAANANRTWSDPSESGQPGTAGGILSWRGPRYQALAATGDLSPEGQAKFFLQENPQLIQALNNASSVEEAQQIMNNAWKFAGYDRPGGEAGRRLAMAKSYYASEFGNAPPANGGAAAIEAIAPLEQGDTSGTESAYVDPYVKVEPRQEASVVPQGDAAPYTMASPTAPAPQSRAPMQVADASGRTGVIAQPQAQPTIPVNADLIRRMVQNPITRERGLALWQQATEGRKMGYDFMMGQNGDLIRTDNQGGASIVGNFAKPDRQGLVNVGNGVLYDPNNKDWLTSPNAGQQFRQATPEEANKYGAQAGQFGPDGRFYPVNPPSGTSVSVGPDGQVTFNQGPGVKPLTEGQSKDTVYSTRATAAMPLLNKHEGALLSLGETLASGIPLNLGNYAQTEEFQLARDAGKDFLASILRKDTGAAVTKSEEDLYGRIFLPQPGDKPATVDAKRQRRTLAVEAIKAGMPPQAIANMGKALENAPAYDGDVTPPAPPEPPAPPRAPDANTYPRARNPRTGAILELRNGKWEEVR